MQNAGLILLLVDNLAFCEIIKLKSGKEVQGGIVTQNDEFLILDRGVDINITYYSDEIENILPDKANKQDIKNIFEQRLNDMLSIISGEIPEDEINDDENLETFSKEFPNSNFADDSDFIVLLTAFTGAVMAHNRDYAENVMKRVAKFVKYHPGKKIEKFTYEKWSKIKKSDKFFGTYLYIPYNYILNYMIGYLEFEYKNYDITAKNFSLIRNKLNYSLDPKGDLEAEIYLTIAMSYNFLKYE